MIRLHAVVEGQTEETFVNTVLAPELGSRNIFMDTHCITTGREDTRMYRGGLNKYRQLKRDLTRWMKQDQQPDAWFTTMLDLYALPGDFPGVGDCASRSSPAEHVDCLEARLIQDLDHRRFIPYIQLHEFEALLFSDVSQFAVEFPGNVSVIQQLARIRAKVSSPEDIDDSPIGAPSKRILEILSDDYEKTLAGPAIAKRIGLPTLRRECPHFNQWIEKIEAAAA
jgi:hypothetical protein